MAGQKAEKVIVLGSGLAGLAAAACLKEKGHSVLVLDKGAVSGGRVASRRIGPALFDHGLQHFHAESPEFASALGTWNDAGLIAPWAVPASEPGPHYRVPGGMRQLMRRLAGGLPVRQSCRVLAVSSDREGWRLGLDDGTEETAAALVIAIPAPQAVGLFEAGGAQLPGEARDSLSAISYHRCLAVMARLGGPSGMADGALPCGPEPLAWVADNHAKGVSGEPGALTLLAGPEFSRQYWELGDDLVAFRLFGCVQARLGQPLGEYHVKRWRLARVSATIPERHIAPDLSHPVVFAGEGFGCDRSEGAWLSGLSAGRWMAGRLAA